MPHNAHAVTPESLAALAAGDKDRSRTIVLEYTRSCGPLGTTADEACAALNRTANSVAPRLTELRKLGSIVRLYDATGQRIRRQSRQGCMAAVLVAAEFAPRCGQPFANTKLDSTDHPTPNSFETTESLFGNLSPDRSYRE